MRMTDILDRAGRKGLSKEPCKVMTSDLLSLAAGCVDNNM